MAAAPTPTLSTLLSKTTLTDHSTLLAAASRALKKSKADPEAQHVRIVALLKLDRFDDALRAFEEGGDALKQRARLEWAYALYKSGELERAEEVAGEVGGRGGLHVLAQTTYRAERFERAMECYGRLGEEGEEAGEEENDLRFNRSAVEAQLEWAGKGYLVRKKRPEREDLEAFEGAYNAACGSIARGELGQGEVLLKRAKDLCSASEELTDSEKEAELLPILVQRAYVLTRLGRADEANAEITAMGLSESMAKIPDASTRHVAQVNALTSAADPENPFIMQRRFQQSSQIPKNDALFSFQSAILQQDRYTLDLLCLKGNGVANSTHARIASAASPTTDAGINTLAVLNVAAKARVNPQTFSAAESKVVLKEVLPMLEKRPTDVGLLLTVIQLYLLTNNHGPAVMLLESFFAKLSESKDSSNLDVRFAPGLVGTLVSLYAVQGRTSQIRTELAKATSYWREKQKDGPPADSNLAKAAGKSLLGSNQEKDLLAAGEIFEDLLSKNSSDRSAVAGVVAAYATSMQDKLKKEHIDSLTPVPRLIAGIDVDALEEAGVASLPSTTSSSSKKRPAEKEKEKPRKKKKMQPKRMPKNYEEGKKMDPERWIPMRDRSYWRPKKKKGKGRDAGATQGGMEDEKKVAAPVTGQGGGGGGGGGKKKGKKRK
ncbi:signal recognition particle protein [Aulographum hederae CBS 113979]|uniref:Signal recognition particle subunit SRP72 n=1 Tax=Aulographum hederae CBS 113979 TaxID=1176131 RepID=A0A6G1HD45_9PEZI|nr:signal recognition particle protein [Aulographum hederae CBS 113979]